MLIRELFVSDVTRDIPPVVYFHERSPEKLEAEVSEYIITGGWPKEHPNHRRVPSGIHEEYVRLLRTIAAELDKPGGPDLPNVWISGFYGSGKSSFAKLLGFALDGVALPGGKSLSAALLERDTSPLASELKAAWSELRQKVEPLAVVFDVGSSARDGEHIHSAIVREVQRRLGYCSTQSLVADFELKLERDGMWQRFEETARAALGQPWAEVKDKALAEEDFSRVLAKMFPKRYTDPMSWITSRAGTSTHSESPEEAVAAIADMLAFRSPGRTLFLIVDEVSQYVLSNKDRVDRLRAFATALGAKLKGKAWLLALGQQKLDEEAGESFLIWAKDRFPPKLRIHLAATNIRDVVHKRLLQKTPAAEAELRERFERHRQDLKLFAYDSEDITETELVETYPMLPGHVDLLLRITSALRTRSRRAQGDDQAIRGLLQLLGELFRDQQLAEMPVGALVTLDQIYEVQNTALDSEVQTSMARIFHQCAGDESGLLVRAAKAVALLELIQETEPTTAKLVAQCLFDALDRGNQEPAITEALEELRRRGLLAFSEQHGYKVQSSAGEEWERERRDLSVPRDTLSEIVMGALKHLLASPARPVLEGRPFPLAARFSDGRRLADAVLENPREVGVEVDFRFLSGEEASQAQWIRRSGEEALRERLVWVAGETERVETLARDLAKSRAMVQRYHPRRQSLTSARRELLGREEHRVEDQERQVREAVAAAWLDGAFFFRGRPLRARDQGGAFATAITAAANLILPELFPHFVATQLQPGELLQLIEPELSGPSPKLLEDELGILALDTGRFVPACSGVVPRRVREVLESDGGLGGTALLDHLGAPPYGYTTNVVKACVAGLLRAGQLRIEPEAGAEITAVRDAGVRELFEKDRAFRRASFFPAGEDDIGFPARVQICKFFEAQLGHPLDREDDRIADAVAQHFPRLAESLRGVLGRLAQLPGSPEPPKALLRLGEVFETCIRTCRQTAPTVKLVKKHLDALRDGTERLALYRAELVPEAVQRVRTAAEVRDFQAAQLRQVGVLSAEAETAVERIAAQLELELPWREIAALDPDLELLRQAYAAERGRLLEDQEQRVEEARGRIRGRDGFSTLTAEQSHQALRPLAEVVADTSADAVAPSLRQLAEGFELALRRAEAEANERLDGILSEDTDQLIVRVDLGLHNREVASEQDVEALVEEIRQRLLEQVKARHRVGLV